MKHTLTFWAVLLMALGTQAQTKVYIPQGGNQAEQVAGAARLRELVMDDGRWQLVDSENEADMVVEYKFSSVGVDNANLKIRNIKKDKTYVSKRVSAHYAGAETSGVRSAEKLHERCLKGGAYDNDYRPWTVDGFYKLHARIGVGLGAIIDHFDTYFMFEGMAEYQISPKWAFGAGMDYYSRDINHNYSPSLGLFVDVVDYFPNGQWHTWFLCMKAGINIPLKESGYGCGFDGLTVNIGGGIQWGSNWALEAYLGLASTDKREHELGGFKLSADKSGHVLGGFKLSYNIPIKSVK